ncbi:MAG TPA: DUF2807 domain-containing protein [Bacteroidia bacterium]|jgi:hypothetical protein|nr:DUF2807 domain-containing protein [Bacteroidia bacterium]HQF29493.1 DUF2807 domain-containing protein [Bacteroidia bacterium]HQK97846.1 DUF2807 domain-containing protein [Bacteroidia bacterium]
MKKIVFIIFLSISLSACKDACDCFKGTGDVVTEIRSVSEIKSVDLGNNVDLVIHYDSVPKMRVTAGSHLLGKISTENENGVLKIRNTNKCNWVRNFDPVLIVDLWVPTLSGIYIENASGDVTFSDTLSVSDFRLDSFSSTGNYQLKLKQGTATLAIHNGPADLTAEGEIGNLYLYGVGYGKMDCLKLKTANAYINNKGTNGFYVNPTDILEATINGSGNVYYTGNPSTIKKTETASGKLIHL